MRKWVWLRFDSTGLNSCRTARLQKRVENSVMWTWLLFVGDRGLVVVGMVCVVTFVSRVVQWCRMLSMLLLMQRWKKLSVSVMAVRVSVGGVVPRWVVKCVKLVL